MSLAGRDLAVALAGYLAGGILPGELAVRRLRGASAADLHDNPGGAGTWRLLGPRVAVPVVVFDMAKGALAAWLAGRYASSPTAYAVIAASAVVGHNWPVYFRLRGGRGLGPAAGALAVIHPQVFFLAFLVGALAGLLTRWVPTVGIVGLPLTLAGLARTGDSQALLAATFISAVVAVRQLPWLYARLKARRLAAHP
jgi:glycerol-3-phosphate acyltransferase PlsY